MDQKAKTPKQMLGHASNATDNNSVTRRSPASKPSRSSRSASSPILDYTKQTQREALESRTAARMRELMQGREMSPHGNRGGSSNAGAVGSNIYRQNVYSKTEFI
jgi:hypothetical protein